MPSVAFATYKQSPEMTNDDRFVADALHERGVTVTAHAWDNADVGWLSFDCVVIRSTWDYHLKPQEYDRWLRSFGSTPGRLWNPPSAVADNLNKRYLTVLAGKGFHVIPTVYHAASGGSHLRTVLNGCGWNEVVIKPAVSAGAHGTWRTSLAAADSDQARFSALVLAHDILIQPFVPEIATRGEWSLIFFGGLYSHAVLKRPAVGDFRVQQHCGGHVNAEDPPPDLIDQAASILTAIEHPLLYARVDGIELDGKFVLMELEVNEPVLFVGLSGGAAQRFAEAIMQALSDGETSFRRMSR